MSSRCRSRVRNAAIVFALLLGGALPADSPAQVSPVVQVLQISGHRSGASVRFMLIDPGNAIPERDGFQPLQRIAVLMMFIGGDGTLGLQLTQVNLGSPNFLARSRSHFAAERYVVAIVDAGSDFQTSGLRGRRLPTLQDARHLQDVAAVMRSLRARYPGLPLWAVGTSRGTVSAALAASDALTDARVTPATAPVDGVVLTSSLTGPDASEDLNGVALESISVPVLIVSHKDDLCPITRPKDSRALRKRLTASPTVRFRQFDGGSAPLSAACDPLAPHGYFGIEQRVIESIARWIRRAKDDDDD